MIHWLKLNRLQRKVFLVILAMVIVPMLAAGFAAAQWVSSYFEHRLAQWITEAARVDQIWLKAYQNDALMLGDTLARDPRFVARVEHGGPALLPPSLRRVAEQLGISLLQIYTPEHTLVYSSLPVQENATWLRGQRQAVLKVRYRGQNLLAAVGIVPIGGTLGSARYLVLGSLVNRDFIDELSQLTGLTTRLYYRAGHRYFDLFSHPGHLLPLSNLPKRAWRRLERDRKSFYDVRAETGRYRGLYVPIVDSEGRVEAIMFSGLERRGFDKFVTSRAVLFLAISLGGLIIGGAAGVLISRVVVRPVEHLRNAVMQLAGQDYRAAVPINSNDELGDLAKAFNAMAIRLREARDEQQRLFQKDKLAALGELSAALAHEIRNPIGVINTASALLEKPTQPEKRVELLRMIREESVRVSGLIQDFLQLSRHRQPSFSDIDPTAPLNRALATVLADREDVQVAREFRHGVARIRADGPLLQQAWINLFTNALEAMDGNAQLWIESEVQDGRLRLSVEDSGPGIAAEVMPRLFEPFFTTKAQGTGLGLSIAHTLVEANGGSLAAEMPKRSGARFVMEFPVVPADDRA
ncbi:MAG: sensor histidine kinase [Acidiferrobacteraceae bacterium]